MTCDKCKDMMTEALYNELRLRDKTLFDDHVSSCTSCLMLFEGLKKTSRIMDQRITVDLTREQQENYWKSVRSKIEAEQRLSASTLPSTRRSWWGTARIPAWSYSLAAVLLVAFGIFLGKNYFTSPPQESNGPESSITTTSTEDSVNIRALAYLERSRNLLLGVVNTADDDQHPIDLSHQQTVSRQLVMQASYLKSSLNRPDQQQMRQLIHDLEVILIQLANTEVKPGVPALELVRKGVYQKSILLKINVEELRAMYKYEPPREVKKKYQS